MGRSSVRLSGPANSSIFTSEPDLADLKDKSILVTGGASGLGAKFVETLARAGAYVTSVDIQDKLGEANAEALSKDGCHVQFSKADIRSWADQVRAFKDAIRFSPSGDTIDHVLINAGVLGHPFMMGFDKPVTSLEDELSEPNVLPIQVNTVGAMYSLKLAQLYMPMPSSAETTTSKSVTFITSATAYMSMPSSVCYGASKFGTRGLFRTAREPLATLGIRVNSIAPWNMDTPMSADIKEAISSMGIGFTAVMKTVNVALSLMINQDVAGRAIALGPSKVEDIRDDEEGGDGGPGYFKLIHSEIPELRGQMTKMFGMMGLEVDQTQKYLF